MNPENRTLKQVTIENMADADMIFTMLMGEEVAPPGVYRGERHLREYRRVKI